MAAMLQQQYVVQETEPRDWAACGYLCHPCWNVNLIK